eukprot:313979-Pleurochrysis_carterae.AAC.1
MAVISTNGAVFYLKLAQRPARGVKRHAHCTLRMDVDTASCRECVAAIWLVRCAWRCAQRSAVRSFGSPRPLLGRLSSLAWFVDPCAGCRPRAIEYGFEKKFTEKGVRNERHSDF